VAVNFIDKGNESTEEKRRPVARTIQLDRCIYYAIFRLDFFF